MHPLILEDLAAAQLADVRRSLVGHASSRRGRAAFSWRRVLGATLACVGRLLTATGRSLVRTGAALSDVGSPFRASG